AGAGHRVSFLRMLGRFEESHGGRLFLKQAAYLHHMAGRDHEWGVHIRPSGLEGRLRFLPQEAREASGYDGSVLKLPRRRRQELGVCASGRRGLCEVP
ncbi:MAG: hypothetical protein Q8S43_08295, partial [Actinomycetota bacterium]|nr:hypothetical protein [Actinomycetota bacterium]